MNEKHNKTPGEDVGPVVFEKGKPKKGIWQATKKGLFFTFSGLKKGLFYLSGFWIIYYLFKDIRNGINDIVNRKPPSYVRLSRTELLRKYGMNEEEAHAWAARLRASQKMMILMSVIALMLGWLGGAEHPRMIQLGVAFLTVLFVLIFFILVLRDQWRIEILEGEIEWQPIHIWVRNKFFPNTKGNGGE